MIQTVDTNVGKLIDYLKRSGRLKNTFIIFTSDNGGVYGITHQWPLRAGKGSYYEGGIRVPMIMVWQGKVKPGTSTNQPVVNTDFFPTFLDVAGIKKPQSKILDGRSILPIAKGNTLPPKPIFWDFPIYLQKYTIPNQNADVCFRTRPGSSIRLGSWVLIQYYEDDRPDYKGKHLELYNLETDMGERKNLVNIFSQKTQELYHLLVQWRKDVHAPVPTKLNPAYKPGGCPVNKILKW